MTRGPGGAGRGECVRRMNIHTVVSCGCVSLVLHRTTHKTTHRATRATNDPPPKTRTTHNKLRAVATLRPTPLYPRSFRPPLPSIALSIAPSIAPSNSLIEKIMSAVCSAVATRICSVLPLRICCNAKT